MTKPQMRRNEAWANAARIPVAQVGPGCIELAGLLQHAVRLSERQAAEIALVLQNHVDKGLLIGRVVTGDHDDNNGRTILDWNEL
jgi:GTPase